MCVLAVWAQAGAATNAPVGIWGRAYQAAKRWGTPFAIHSASATHLNGSGVQPAPRQPSTSMPRIFWSGVAQQLSAVVSRTKL